MAARVTAAAEPDAGAPVPAFPKPAPGFHCDPDVAAPKALAREEYAPAISADATRLYWFEKDSLVAMPKSGGEVRRLGDIHFRMSRAVPSGAWVYVADCYCMPGDPMCQCLVDPTIQVLRVPKRGRGAPVAIARFSGGCCDASIALRGRTVYFLAPDQGLMRVSVYGGKAHRVAEVDGDGLLLAGTSAVVTDPPALVDLRTGAVTKLAYPAPPLASDGHEVFGICNEGLCALVPGKKVRILGPLPLEVDAIALDARDVYVAESSEELERVRAFPRHGGAPATIQCGRGSIESMVADRGALFLVHVGTDTDAIERVVARTQTASP